MYKLDKPAESKVYVKFFESFLGFLGNWKTLPLSVRYDKAVMLNSDRERATQHRTHAHLLTAACMPLLSSLNYNNLYI